MAFASNAVGSIEVPIDLAGFCVYNIPLSTFKVICVFVLVAELKDSILKAFNKFHSLLGREDAFKDTLDGFDMVCVDEMVREFDTDLLDPSDINELVKLIWFTDSSHRALVAEEGKSDTNRTKVARHGEPLEGCREAISHPSWYRVEALPSDLSKLEGGGAEYGFNSPEAFDEWTGVDELRTSQFGWDMAVLDVSWFTHGDEIVVRSLEWNVNRWLMPFDETALRGKRGAETRVSSG
jgi:hypothetical protein